MTSTIVEVPFGDNARETATLLLAAAESKYGDQSVVRTTEGSFLVPRDVADEAGAKYDAGDSSVTDEEPAARKSAAKKSTAK